MIQRGWPLCAKRFVDLSVATLASVMAVPVVVGAALTILAVEGRPIFFVQQRPGRNGKPFAFYKLRTMRSSRSQEGDPRFDANRMTPLGRFLRATSIDELPQLINVLRGDMSLVGPRPLLLQYLDRYTPEQRRRHDVLPGITGWAQVKGRNSLSWEEKFALDVWYVDHWSPWLDVRILAQTIVKVVRREGVESGDADGVTMPEFMGTR